MEMSLFQKDGVTWTRFKVRAKEKEQWFLYLIAKFGINVSCPVKCNS